MGSELVGRDPEISDVSARVADHRLVTIVGSGGVGKTALARAVAARVVANPRARVRHVDLTRVTDPARVPEEFARQLGFGTFDALLAATAGGPSLTVADNCEHVLDAAALAISRMLGADGQHGVLATSRSPLEIPGESVVQLTPLELPMTGGDPMGSPAVQLFLERADDAGVRGVVDHLDDVVALCRRLDGLPLAIELAAARLRVHSVREILEGLAESIDVLDRPHFRGDPRHRRLSSTIRWSYDLLTPQAATLLDRLSVFAGPFTRRTVTLVADDPDAVDGLIDELVTASLVVVDRSRDPVLFRLLDAVGSAARERLKAQGDLESTLERMTNRMFERSDEQFMLTYTAWQTGQALDLVSLYCGVVDALNWCIDHDLTPERAHRLCAMLWVLMPQGFADDLTPLMRRLVERFPEVSTPGGARAHAVLAVGELVTGRPQVAMGIATDALAHHDIRDGTAALLHRVRGQSFSTLGARDRAMDAYRDAIAILEDVGPPILLHDIQVATALTTADDGNLPEGLAALDAVIADCGDAVAPDRAWAIAARAWLLARIDPESAVADADVALASSRLINYPVGVAVSLRARAYALLQLDRASGAVSAVEELLDDLSARGALSNLRMLADAAAALAHRTRHRSWASLRATALSLPITSLACSLFEPIEQPRPDAAPLAPIDVFKTVREMIADLRAAGDSSVGPGVVEPPAEHEARFRWEAGSCEIEFGGRHVSLRRSKGLACLMRLVAAAGTEVHCAELAGRAVDQSSTGEVIDSTARHDYEARIRSLQDEVDAAERDNDYGRSYRLQVELDTMIDHLAASLGMGNRTRVAPGSNERARSAVTHLLRRTVRDVGRVHPALGSHFAHSIKTGTYCAYRPERAVAWIVECDASRRRGSDQP